jgi:predicted ATPase/class 3 adenylate cyclase
MGELPSGTVSLLFSDIEGSTLLLSRLGQAYADALDGQRQVLRKAWAGHGGTELGTEGDSFFVVFRTAEDAVEAAIQAQRQLAAFLWPGNENVRVRMGVHTGTPTVHDGGYVGMDVHRAARIAAAAHGGQVALSAATAGLVRGCLPDGVRLRDLGSHHLKDIPAPEHLFDLAVEDLETAFPRPGTPLVGRDGELAEVSFLLTSPEVRLVTLTGPGGSGKTRLAIGLAQQLVERFPNGLYFVPLATVATPEVMWTTIAEVLGVPPEQRAPPRLFEYVAHRSALFVLDNLEQIDGADNVVAELLEAAQQVMVIATSRRPLHIPDEYEHAVPPLELPEDQSLDAVTSAGAVQLFAQHARKVNAGFSLTESNAADVAAVCRRLDGLPLAIELAAVRCKLLSPAALLSRLDAALDMAAAGRQGPSRQKTLRDTIAWSYDLLSSTQQQFFRHLGVFAGGADLDAIAAVTADIVGSADPFDLVAELVDSSLATITEADGGEPRVGMLETVRTYALDQLEASGELAAVRQRHAEHYLKVAEEMDELLNGELYLQARARFEMEHDNFRAVLRQAVEPHPEAGRDETGGALPVRLCAALAGFWGAGGYYAEMRRWLEQAVNREHGRDSPELARCLTELAFSSHLTGDVALGIGHASASVEMWRRLDDQSGLPRALGVLGELEIERGHFDTARSLYEEYLTLARASGDSRLLLGALGTLANLDMSERRYDTSLELFRQAVAIARELGDPVKLVINQHNLACTLHRMGQFEKAATQMLDQAAQIVRLDTPWMLVVFAEDYAATLAELGASSDAVRLLGAADALRDRMGLERSPSQQVYIADPIAKTRDALNPEEWSASYEAGRGMTIERALPEAPSADSM